MDFKTRSNARALTYSKHKNGTKSIYITMIILIHQIHPNHNNLKQVSTNKFHVIRVHPKVHQLHNKTTPNAAPDYVVL
jgi:hypothetical protein